MKIKISLLFFLWINVFSFAQTTDLKLLNINDGLPENSINSITQDRVGYLYLGTKNNGIARFDGKEFEVFNEKSGLLSNSITALFYKNDSLWIASNKGISVKTNNQIFNFESSPILKIYNFKNQYYFLTENGISYFENNKITSIRFPSEIEKHKINDLVFDGNYFWIATNKNLFKAINLKSLTGFEKIMDGNFSSLLLYNNKLIYSNLNKGIFVLNDSKIIEKINSNTTIVKIKKINKQLWLLSKDNGVELISVKDFTFIKRINKYNTIGSNKINDVFIDKQNSIWFSSDVGLYLQTFKEQKTTLKPAITLTNINVEYQSLDSININSYDKILSLKPNQNYISFSYKSVDLAKPNSILYRYKLNEKFSPWSKNSSVNFANLEAGKYNFYVQSKNENHKSELKKFSFNIDIPFYEKTIFQMLFFIGLLLVILLLSWFNMYRLKRKNNAKIEKLELENHLNTLEQKAMQLQMNPHFIFNVLNGIKAYGISGNKTELSATISKFATLLRSILNSSKLAEISLQSEIETLQNYIALSQQISPILFEYKIEKSLKNCSEEEILIPPMLLQPFVENAIEHAFNKQTKDNLITISFDNKNGFLLCAIQDNGVGIYKNQQQKSSNKHQSLAIKITKERIKNITKYNLFTIEELKEKSTILGTKVSFKIPLKTDY